MIRPSLTNFLTFCPAFQVLKIFNNIITAHNAKCLLNSAPPKKGATEFHGSENMYIKLRNNARHKSINGIYSKF